MLVHNSLIIGTNQYVLAVNPTDASTLFYRPVADEVTCIAPCHSEDQETFVFMGGDSGSVTGLTRAGNDTFWTVLDSKITSILSLDEEHLITGTLGGRISKIKIIDNQVTDEVVKGDSVQKLVSLKSEGEIAYLLSNFTIGILDSNSLESEDVWRVKTKHAPIDIIYSTHCDGILLAFKTGKLEIRSRKNGEVIWDHTTTNTSLTNLASENHLIDETFKIYNLSIYENSQQIEKNQQRMAVVQREAQMLKFEAIEREKQDKLDESKMIKNSKTPDVDISIKTSLEHRAIVVKAVLSHKTWIVRSLTVFADGLWPGKECKVQSVEFSAASNSMIMVLVDQMPKFSEIRQLKLNIKCAISVKSSQVSTFQNIERNSTLFPLQFYQINEHDNHQVSLPFVEIILPETISRQVLNQCFQELFGSDEMDNLEVIDLVSCFDDSSLQIVFLSENSFKICTESISTAAFIIQFIARKSKASGIESVCNGYDFQELRDNFLQLDDLKQTVERLRVELNEIGNMTKAAIVHLEDGRKRGDCSAMRNSTQALTNFNRDLRQMATLKQDNTGKLKEIQELIHQSIQIGCRLRVGQASAELMSQCMNVLKNTNSESNEQLASSLISLIQFGVNL